LDELNEPERNAVLGRGWRARATATRGIEVKTISRVDAAAAQVADRQGIAEHVFTGRALLIAPLFASKEQQAWAESLAEQLGDDQPDEGPWRRSLRALLRAQASPDSEGHVVPIWDLPEADTWVDLGSLALDPDPLLAGWPDPHGVGPAAKAFVAALRDGSDLTDSATALDQAIRAAGTTSKRFPDSARLQLELTYRAVGPFTWAWVLFVFAGIISAIGIGRSGKTWRIASLSLLIPAIVFIVWGLSARMRLSSEVAAVSNLYDTFPFVALIAGLIGVGFTLFTRNLAYACAAGFAAGLCAMVGEALPPDHGQYLEPLRPVLRYRFWLWLHVKIIVGSYGAFLLAWMLGNIELTRAAMGRRQVQAASAKAIYRVLQIGVVLCTAGTLLGGVWADYSWGRFWGWDPKEVWALVIILTYLVPLHLRYIGAVSHAGLAGWSVFGFLAVVMSWYGVNFLLGAGKHAYATGSGFAHSVSTDQFIVLGLCVVQIIYTVLVMVLIRRQPKAGQGTPASADTPPTPPLSTTP
jgi:ABC-type transport system involved in cytochrome c biogenesis permease subunit